MKMESMPLLLLYLSTAREFTGINTSARYFTGMYFTGMYFVGVCFVGVCFVGVCFVGVCFVGVCFVGVCFVGVCFVGVCFVRINFIRINFIGIKLIYSVLIYYAEMSLIAFNQHSPEPSPAKSPPHRMRRFPFRANVSSEFMRAK